MCIHVSVVMIGIRNEFEVVLEPFNTGLKVVYHTIMYMYIGGHFVFLYVCVCVCVW